MNGTVILEVFIAAADATEAEVFTTLLFFSTEVGTRT